METGCAPIAVCWGVVSRVPADIAMVVPATMPMATPLVLGAATGAG